MDYLADNLPFNPKPSTIMHIDLNSCFATIEQQANPLLRNRPIAVAAYTTGNGCILAPSIEAKKLGIKVGMRVKEGKLLCPGLQILAPDPWKYRNIHTKLRDLISTYTADFTPKSIDEFVLNFEGYPAFKLGMQTIGQQIKTKIKQQIGDWLTVSIGIGPNFFLAKLAANLHKPDGLDEINSKNFQSIYSSLCLTDLPGIKNANTIRLNSVGIHTLLDFFKANVPTLKSAFRSILGYYWYLRLRGFEIDDVQFGRKSFGNMYSLQKRLTDPQDLSPLLCKLVEKSSFRMRSAGFSAGGVHIGLLYQDHSFWHHGKALIEPIFSSNDIYKYAYKIMVSSPYHLPVSNLSVSLFNLVKTNSNQLDLFGKLKKKVSLTSALDKINHKWGNFVITPALMLGTEDRIVDRVSFGNIKELEQFIINQ